MSNKKRYTRNDVAYAYLTGGVSAVDVLQASRAVLRLALIQLRKDKEDYEALEKWCIEKHGLTISSPGKNGRGPPVAGGKRIYKAQTFRQGTPFLKVPVNTLGVERGARLVTTFTTDRIIIERAAG